MTTEKKSINVLDILTEAESVPEEERNIISSSSEKSTLFKSTRFKKGKRTETSLIDDIIVDAVKSLHSAGKNEVSFFALTKLFEATNYRLKNRLRIAEHVQAKDVFTSFFDVKIDKLVFKQSILTALELETKKPKTKKKA